MVKPGHTNVYIGKQAFDSLLEATFKENGKVSIVKDTIFMKVDDLDEMVDGFSTAFDENSNVKITARVEKITATQFDYDFGNFAFKADLSVDFTNPIDDRFLATQALITLRGSSEVTLIDQFKLSFNIHQEKAKV